MGIVIRENITQHMQDLKKWLSETEDESLEEMGAFFSARIDGYEDHMGIWKNAYRRFAEFVPQDCGEILDLGCGTGLELDEIWKKYPLARVTGVDLCRDMLDKLLEKHRDKNIRVFCDDYFQFDMGESEWGLVLSFESLHHFLPAEKMCLYGKIYRALRDKGSFLMGDYLACCEEEELLLQSIWREKRTRFQIPEGAFVHFDIPLTLEHETALLREAGFKEVTAVDCIEGAVIILAEK